MSTEASIDTAYETFVLDVDDVDWTKHWLGKRRCDLLVISVARRPEISPKVRIRAVESKATSKVNPVDPDPGANPFREGIEQVVATLEALWSLLDPSQRNPLVEDLRFSSFVEHIASVALAGLHPFHVDDRAALFVVRTISDFSLRKLTTDEIHLDGAVVCTQYRTAAEREAQRHSVPGSTREWTVDLIRAGAKDLEGLLGSEVAELAMKLEEEEEPLGEGEGDAGVDSGGEGGGTRPRPTAPEGVEAVAPEKEAEISGEVPTPTATSTEREVTVEEEPVGLAKDVFLACRSRGFPVHEPNQDHIVVGPSLIAVSMALQAGASIRPIESAEEDLAREVGVQSVTVENDPDRPFHVRFLAARRDRQFLNIPEAPPQLVDEDTQSYLGLYLGSTLQGEDFMSFISSWPHMLVGGTTGSGKTTFIRSILLQLGRLDSAMVRVIVVDGKGEIDYLKVLGPEYFTHRFPDVVMGHQRVNEVLEWIVEEEIPTRRKLILERARAGGDERPRPARELYVNSALVGEPNPFVPLVVIIDEFAELMIRDRRAAGDFEQRVQQVSQVGRTALIHLMLATQRPDASVVSGAIKANLDARVALRLPTHHDSMTILGRKGAELLLGNGDLMFQAAGLRAKRLQGYKA